MRGVPAAGDGSVRLSGSVRLNGTLAPLVDVPAHANALDWVRAQGLTGAKEGCAEGECGACAVLVARPGSSTPTTWVALNSCLIPALALEGQEVVTVEGLGAPDALHPVQRELAHRGGTQCGYCTPGFVCAMAAEYYRTGRAPAVPPPGTGEDPAGNGFDLDALSGNLCRCTGYRPIRDAARALGRPEAEDPLAGRRHLPAPVPSSPGVRSSDALHRPADLAEAVRVLAERPGAVVVAGATDWGVQANLRGARAPLVVAIDGVPELRVLTSDATCLTIGAALTLTELERDVAARVPLIAELLPRFASRLVRNAATLGGNLATASPIGDGPPVLLALGAQLVLASAEGERIVEVADFFTGYRETVLGPGELIVAVRIPLPLAATVSFQKTSKRRVDDISSVSVAVAMEVEGAEVSGVRIGLGGVSATPIRARATERALMGQRWDHTTVQRAAAVLAAEGSPWDDHRASAAYRSDMLGKALPRLLAQTRGEGIDP